MQIKKKPPKAASFLFDLLQEQLFEQQHPDEVEPADEHTAKGHDQADDQAKKTALLRPSGPSYHNLGYPVYTGDQEKKKLYQAALFVKPSHREYLLKVCI